MRTPPSRTSGDEPIELIHLVDADPVAFGSNREVPSHEAESPHRRARVMLAAVGGIAVVAAAVVLLWPSHSYTWRALADAQARTTLPPELVFGDPPSPLLSAASRDANPAGASLGYVFAVPGAHVTDGKWFMVRVAEVPPASAAAAGSASKARVEPIDSARFTFSWSPVPTQVWTATASGFAHADDAKALAAGLSLRAGQLAIRTDVSLHDLQPLGSTASFDIAVGLHDSLDTAELWPDVTEAMYLSVRDTTAVASVAAPQSALAMTAFIYRGSDTTVHGLPAVTASGPDGLMVAWMEGGRLVAVANPGGADALIGLAESVEVAPDQLHWADNAPRPAEPPSSVTIDSGTSPSGHTWTVTAAVSGRVTTFCANVDDTSDSCVSAMQTVLTDTVRIETTAGPIVIGLAATGIVRTLVVTTGGVTVQLPLHPLFWNVQAAALLATPDASFSVPG